MNQPREEFLSLLAHELRTPVSAIIGYHDLISDGILGEIDPRIAESLARIRSSADQILTLVACLGEAATDDVDNLHLDTDIEDPRAITEKVLRDLTADANGRATNVLVDGLPDEGEFVTDCERLERALLLGLHAAIKVTAGGDIHFQAGVHDNIYICTIRGARLDPDRDTPANGIAGALTSAGMRLAMAHQAVRPLDGAVTLAVEGESTVVTVRVPSWRGDD